MLKRVLIAGAAVLLLSVAAACGGDSSSSATTASTSTTTTRTAEGPTTTLNPKFGPPGIDVTASGTGWPAGVEVAITGGAPGAKPYATAITDRSGAFSAKFFLEKKPDGSALETGRFDIIASSGSTVVTVPYVVQVPRPTGGPGPGGG
jgi:ABC-type glycerol-3-phosphate transport system substrate-binding protein